MQSRHQRHHESYRSYDRRHSPVRQEPSPPPPKLTIQIESDPITVSPPPLQAPPETAKTPERESTFDDYAPMILRPDQYTSEPDSSQVHDVDDGGLGSPAQFKKLRF